ncbi:LamG domain-containing protein [Cryobacterium sp. CG_9.6]|uniref:LamG domain-containing protein n=1 Tax=Cryobacterium sp. CG_9.6 TaxID=2760710 RepID=UPI002476F3ED|nr:LamG domain-containing protein [Cryobacterium sp. CG_9.6]MDH6238425.1 hypothetical protein [Cryobacterium sp. CG_9.6]
MTRTQRIRCRMAVIAGTMILVLISAVVSVPAYAFWSVSTVSPSSGAASAASVNPGSAPTLTVTKNNIRVSWAATTLSNGVGVSGYIVTRYSAENIAQVSLTGCSGVIASISCLESNVPDGLWTYTVTPKFATNWIGAPSAGSASVRSDATAPINSVSLTDKSGGGSFLTGSTLYFRGAIAGAFRLTNTLTDVGGSGPASSSTASLGSAADWTHAPSAVSTPAGGPFVSNSFSWIAGAVTEPTIAINGLDNAGNSAAAPVIQLRLDNTGPTGGAISYAGSYTTASSVFATVQAVADAGAGTTPGGTRTLQRATALLSGNACGSFSAFADHVTNPAVAPATQALTVVPGTCYKYQYVVTDNVGNQTTTTSPNVVRARNYQTIVGATPGIQSHWRLADTGTVADDIGPANNDGTYFGAPTLSQSGAIVGDLNTAVVFDGINDYASVPRQISTDFSIEFWFKANPQSNGRNTPKFWYDGAGLVDADVSGVAGDFGVSLTKQGNVAAGTGNPDVTVLSNKVVDDNAWHHVVMTRTQSTGIVQLFVDGTFEGSVTGGTQALTGPVSIDFGRTQATRNYFAGSLDEIAIYTSVLSAATVRDHNFSGR